MAGDTDHDRTGTTPGSLVDSVEQFGSRWRLVVLRELLAGETRIETLDRSIDASRETLSNVLDDLQDLGFVTSRTETQDLLETDYQCSQELTGSLPNDEDGPETPVRRYYSLTPKGASLESAFTEIERWGDEWLDRHSDP